MNYTNGGFELTPEFIRDPKWAEASKVHDFRNYISDKVRVLWPTFTDEQKLALIEQADEQADSEEWD